VNLCILKGKVINKPKFEFIYKGKNISKIEIGLKLENESIVRVQAFDERADELYRNTESEDTIYIIGRLSQNGIIQIE